MTIKGYSDRKHERKYGANDQQYTTVQTMHDDRVGLDSVNRVLFAVEEIVSTAIVDNVLTLVGNTAKSGDIVQHIISGDEFVVVSVNGQEISCTRPIPVSYIGENFEVKRYVTPKANKDGTSIVSVSPAPTSFIKDSVTTTATEDTVDPTNNDPFPSKLFIQKDGKSIPVNKDTVAPSNTVGIPVEIVQASGTEINITSGDINVQTSHTGANFDSMRIGDGTNLMGVNASLEALVHDQGVVDALTAGQLSRAGSLGVTLSVEDQATQDAILTRYSAGQEASATSQPVVLSTEQEALLSSLVSNNSNSILASIYVDTAITTITPAGVTVGSIASAGRKLFVQNNANSIAIEVDGVQVGASLPGQTFSLDVDMGAGNIVLKSFGASISGGDITISITG